MRICLSRRHIKDERVLIRVIIREHKLLSVFGHQIIGDVEVQELNCVLQQLHVIERL